MITVINFLSWPRCFLSDLDMLMCERVSEAQMGFLLFNSVKKRLFKWKRRAVIKRYNHNSSNKARRECREKTCVNVQVNVAFNISHTASDLQPNIKKNIHLIHLKMSNYSHSCQEKNQNGHVSISALLTAISPNKIIKYHFLYQQVNVVFKAQ